LVVGAAEIGGGIDGRLDGAGIGLVHLHHAGTAAEPLHRARDPICALAISHVAHRDVTARPRQRRSDGGGEIARAARDHRPTSLKVHQAGTTKRQASPWRRIRPTVGWLKWVPSTAIGSSA
jgi:hypothetical protein